MLYSVNNMHNVWILHTLYNVYKVYIVYCEYSTSSVCTVQAHLRCIVPQKYLEARDAPETSWYQWVTFMMVLQAAAFYLPFKVDRWTGQGGLKSI